MVIRVEIFSRILATHLAFTVNCGFIFELELIVGIAHTQSILGA